MPIKDTRARTQKHTQTYSSNRREFATGTASEILGEREEERSLVVERSLIDVGEEERSLVEERSLIDVGEEERSLVDEFV